MMFRKSSASTPFQKNGLRHRTGMALVVTLAVIVLVTIAVMAFFVRATSNRVVEATRSNQVLVQQVAATGADYVAGQFLREIAAKSTASTVESVPIYQPSTNTFAIPQRTVPSALFAVANFPSLIRRSATETADGIGEANASAHNSASPSKNGRKVGADRWNAPFLNLGAGFTATNQLPNWIYLNRDGTVTSTASTNVIGRFAYMVYDISGLLDANVAGFPSTVAGADLAAIKSTLAGADLSVIPGISAPGALVGWRNKNGTGTAAAYVAGVIEAAGRGFLRPPAGDQRIVSRQDLIKLARTGKYGLSLGALPYLTQFSRALNTPSWTPELNASQMTNYVAPLVRSARNYRDVADSSNSVTRNIPNVRVTLPFTRRDGTKANVGDPLIKQRFPLSKLALVRPYPDSVTATEVLKYFGLTWNSAGRGWEYRGLTINTLAQVAAAGREPDFFELLKAGLLDGSLGKATANDTNVRNLAVDRNADLQILGVGANLIDQADADDIPTTILRDLATEIVLGIENHPYIHIMSQTHFRRRDRDYFPLNVGNPQPWVAGYQQMQVWNPHLNAAATGRSYRIRALQGMTRTQVRKIDTGDPVDQSERFIAFGGSTAFAEPALLTPDNISNCSPENRVASMIGFHLGDAFAPNNKDGDGNHRNDYSSTDNDASYIFDIPIVYQLEYLDGLSWVPLQRIYPLFGSNGQSQSPDSFWTITDRVWNAGDPKNRDMNLQYCKTDPRSQRFGFYSAGLEGNVNNSTMRRSTSPVSQRSGYPAWGGGPSGGNANANPGWKVSYPLPVIKGVNSQGYTPDDLSDNRMDSPTYIADPDGVVRPADGTSETNIPGVGSQARPVMLNRPFLSVGEMAYALRGDPWKTLDFASAASADSALLDLFSVSDIPGAQAGMLNPNRAAIPVLQAILTQAEIDPGISSRVLSSAEAQGLATALNSLLTAQPIQNRADLTRMIDEIESIPGALHKRQTEVLIRTLSDISNTRTWNLMADVVAQSGSFLTASTGPGDFVVQGEQRIWEHLAIDRPTGKIITQVSELCPE